MSRTGAGVAARGAVLVCAVAFVAIAAEVRGGGAEPASITFAQDIAPLVAAHCIGCHRPLGSAPFSLTTYEEVRAHADAMAAAMAARVMPPWKPEPGHGEFIGNRRLLDSQIDLIRRWIAGGRLEGEPASTPIPLPNNTPWQLGQPDLVIEMNQSFLLPAGSDDVYRHFVIPIPIAGTRYVKAWELRPNNLKVVHHATLEIDGTGASRHLDEQDPQPGYEGLVSHAAMAPDGYFLGWAPGQTPYVSPDGMAFPILKNSDLVLMLHLRPGARTESVQVSVGLYFSDTPPTRVPALLRLTRQDFEIPAMQERVVTSSFTLPVDIDVYTVQPHAHNLARRIESFATLPNGAIRPLISINDWDFNWQDVYRYVRPVSLPAGTTIVARWTYDNTRANRHNPNNPPKPAMFGPRTSDEMFEVWFQVVPRNEADRARLLRDVGSAVTLESIKGYEMMLHGDPDNAAMHDDLALLYASAGDLDRVTAQFAETLRLKPQSAAARYNLGTALLAQKRLGEARRAFESAIEADQDYAKAYHALGSLFYADRRFDDAEKYYVETVRLAPEDATVHHDLGVLFQTLGRADEAIAQYRVAVALDPGNAQSFLGLAAALAATGRIDEAIAAERSALTLATGARDDALAGEARRRLNALMLRRGR